MALILLQVLLLGVLAAAVDDVPVTWSASPHSTLLQCEVVDKARTVSRRPPPPPLDDERPKPKPYLWRRGKEEFSERREPLNVYQDREGDGLYQCGVKFHHGIVLGYPVNLKFPYIKDEFSSQPQDVEGYLRQPLVIPCRIESGPPATVAWFRNGQRLQLNYRYHLLKDELLITDVRSEDAGVYRCIASNTILNQTITSAEGVVTVVPSTSTAISLLPLHHGDYTAPLGGSLVLPCPVIGWPRQHVIWKLTPPHVGARTSELESSEEVLRLSNLGADQVGVYTCSVEGRSDLVQTYNVTYTIPVKITHPPISKEVKRAGTVRLNCTATGSPKPKIYWYKDGEPLLLASRFNLRTSADHSLIQLVISGITSNDAGVYQCFASNGITMASQWAELTVTGPAVAAPVALKCAPTGPTSVSLSWGTLDKVTGYYIVHWEPTDMSEESKTGQPLTNSDMTVPVRGLTPYRFQVRLFSIAVNNYMPSDMSKDVVCQGQGVPVRLLKLQDNQVGVSWRHFAERNPGVVQWILQYSPNHTLPDTIQNVTLDGSVNNYTLNVASSALYVRVLGSRTLDWLPQNLSLVPWTSTDQAGKDFDAWRIAVPYGLRVVEVMESNLTVSWQCEGAERYTFLVCVRKLEATEDCQESLKTNATVENLEPGSEYEVRVQARVPGRARAGAFSEPYHVVTASQGSKLFRNLTYAFVNSSAVRITWSGDARNYTVRYSSRLKEPIEQWPFVITNVNTAVISGIEPTESTFVIVSGYQPLAHSPVLNVPPQMKDMPKDLEYSYSGSDVRVWWPKGATREVRVSQNVTQPIDTWKLYSVTDSSIELHDLTPSLPVHVLVSVGGHNQMLNIPARPANENFGHQLGIGLGVGFCLLCVFCVLIVVFVCVWRKKKIARNRSPNRSRVQTTQGVTEEAEMRAVGASGPRGNGTEPLLNGHVHIIDNPASKTPNGKVKKARRYDAFDSFDVSREPERTAECSFGGLLDTSRPPPDLIPSRSNGSFKLPDDNMNSELTHGTFQLDNSKIQPTLQPNG
ncbi:protogenin isoform X2 [Pieris rapae]|uniref:protogenin isoform X2 n=1 Tax=Pieris rapae TaxID=64459 RepID=UPI001E281A3C|nr:protogenin isoform X2 [Pieris rapae]